MPYKRPTLKELIETIEKDLYARFNNETRPNMFSVIKVLARVIAGACYLLYGFVEWTMRQMFPDKAEGANFERWPKMFNVQRKKPEYSRGTAIFTGEDGAKIKLYSKIQTQNNFIFQTIKEVEIKNKKAEVEIFAMATGKEGNLEPGTILSLISPISSVDSVVTLGSIGTHSGADLESIESWRERFLFRLRNPPCAGNQADYEAWALEIPGITRAWCYPRYPKKGSVGLTFVRDNDEKTIPNSEQIEIVRSIINTKMPVTAELFIFPLVPLVINFVIQLQNNNNINRNKVKETLKNLIADYGAPEKTIKFYQIIIAIQSKDIGITDFNIISPKEDITTNKTEIHTLGTIEFRGM